MIRLATHRRKYDQPLGDLSAWARVMADNLVFTRGLDFYAFRDLARLLRIDIPEDVAMAAIRDVAALLDRKGRLYQPLAPAAVAAMLQVTSEEKWAAEIRTMGAIDADPVKDAALSAEERRASERERASRRRAERAAQEGKPPPRPRREYEAGSQERCKPWEAVGMKRSAWFKARKPTVRPSSDGNATSTAIAA